MRVWTGNPEAVDDGWVRLGVALALSAAAVGFFRDAAVPGLAAAAAGSLLVVLTLWGMYRWVGLRSVGRLWPGAAIGVATGLLIFNLSPPGLPLWILFLLAAVGVLVEGALGRLRVPLAVGGVMIAWPLAWLWQARSGVGYISPFQLRPQLEPIALWTKFQLELDPLRLYTGNIAGPLGATSFGLATIGFAILAYVRKTSWLFLLAYYVPIAAAIVGARQSLPVYLISGPAMVFAGLVAADTHKLPPNTAWRVGAGAAAGALSALLLLRGGGPESYGAGLLAALVVVSLFQLFGLAGRPAVITEGERQSHAEGTLRVAPAQLAALVLFAPLGLLLVFRNRSLPQSQRQILAGLGLVLYVAAVAGTLVWLWALRLPA